MSLQISFHSILFNIYVQSHVAHQVKNESPTFSPPPPFSLVHPRSPPLSSIHPASTAIHPPTLCCVLFSCPFFLLSLHLFSLCIFSFSFLFLLLLLLLLLLLFLSSSTPHTSTLTHSLHSTADCRNRSRHRHRHRHTHILQSSHETLLQQYHRGETKRLLEEERRRRRRKRRGRTLFIISIKQTPWVSTTRGREARPAGRDTRTGQTPSRRTSTWACSSSSTGSSHAARTASLTRLS